MTPDQYAKWMAARYRHGGYSGGAEQPEHYIWRAMMARCYNPKAASYAHYGARGVKVCKRWHDYRLFLADMGVRPDKGYSLDRIRVDGDYKPSNCRWATRSEQQKNKTSTRWFSNGEFTGTLVECAALVGISKALALWRWKTWGSFEKDTVWRQRPKAS